MSKVQFDDDDKSQPEKQRLIGAGDDGIEFEGAPKKNGSIQSIEPDSPQAYKEEFPAVAPRRDRTSTLAKRDFAEETEEGSDAWIFSIGWNRQLNDTKTGQQI